MASFSPEPQVSQSPDWTGASQRSEGNKAFGSLFAGIGDLVEGAVFTADQAVKTNIEKDVRYGFDTLNDEMNLSPTTVPAELTRSQQGLQKLALAHQQGKVTPEYYYQRLASQLKALRTKYPGYEAEVDDIVQNVTGERPANAYRNALLQNIANQEAQAASSANKYETWLNQSENQGIIATLFPDFDWANQGGSKYSEGQVKAAVAAVKAQEFQWEHTKASIAGNKAAADLALNERANQITSTYLSGTSNVVGFGTDSFMQTLKTMTADGGGLSPEEIGSMTQYLDQIYVKAAADFDKNVADPAFQKLYTPQELAERRDAALKPIAKLKEMIANNQWSEAAIVAGRNQLTQDKSLAGLYKTDPNLATISGLSKVSPDLGTFLGQSIMMDAGGPREYLRGITMADQVAEVVSGSDRVDNVFQRVYNNPNSTTQEKNQQLRSLTSKLVSVVTSGKASPQELKTAIENYNYLDEMFSALDPGVPSSGGSQHLRLFNQLFNPDVTKQVVATGDKQMASQYFTAALNKFKGIPEFRVASTDLTSIKNTKGARLVYNPEKNRVDIQTNDTGFDTVQEMDARDAYLGTLMRVTNTLNQGLSIMVPMIEGMGGVSEEEGVKELIGTLSREVDGHTQGRLWNDFYSTLQTQPDEAQPEGDWKTINPTTGEVAGDVELRGNSSLETPDGTSVELSSYAPDGTADTERMFDAVLGAGRGYTEVQLADGSRARLQGPRNWRNNNPGNIEYGAFAKANGAIGSDGRFAIFPSYEVGRQAKANLLFNSKSYRNLSLADAIDRYAPPNENDTDAYTNSVARAIGVDPETKLSDLTPEQRSAMLDAMQRVEGWKPGKVVSL